MGKELGRIEDDYLKERETADDELIKGDTIKQPVDERQGKIKRLDRLPFVQKKSMNPTKKTKSIMNHERITDRIRDQLKKEKIDTAKIAEILKEIDNEGGKIIKENKFRGPGLILIRANNNADIFENIKPGLLRITRSDGRTGQINLSNKKLINLNWGDEKLNLWVVDETNANALPQDPEMDSATGYQVIEEIVSNRKNLEAQKIKAWEGLSGTIIFGIIIMLGVVFVGVPMLTGKSVWEWADTGEANGGAQVNNTTDTVNEAPDAELTPEQQAKIDQIKNGESGG